MAQIDALLLLPLLSSLKIGNATLLVNVDTRPRAVAGRNAWNYNASGQLVAQGKPVVQPGGFTVLHQSHVSRSGLSVGVR